MKYNHVGNSGLMVSEVGLGCNNLGRRGTPTESLSGATAVVNAAIDAGITLFDTADIYGKEPGLSERFLGEALGSRRNEVVVATKFGMSLGEGSYPARGSRRYLIRAVEDSLRRLNTDRIDLYQYHTPDAITPIEETIATLEELVQSGKILYYGHSNFAGWQIADAAHIAKETGSAPFISSQNHYNLLDRRAELEVIPAASHYGLGLLPYFPLANGLLSGKYTDGVAPAGSRLSHTRRQMLANADFEQLKAFRAFSQARGLSELEVAFSWLANNPTIPSVIAGATTPAQVQTNARATQWNPTPEDWAELDVLFPRPEKIALF